jgi:hypothetical protein
MSKRTVKKQHSRDFLEQKLRLLFLIESLFSLRGEQPHPTYSALRTWWYLDEKEADSF